MSAIDELARSRIEDHIEGCERRQTEICKKLDSIWIAIEGIYNRFWVAAVSIIVALFGLVGFLLTVVFKEQLL